MNYPIIVLKQKLEALTLDRERIYDSIDGKTDDKNVYLAVKRIDKYQNDIRDAINILDKTSTVDEKDHPPTEASLIKKKA